MDLGLFYFDVAIYVRNAYLCICNHKETKELT